MMRKYIENKSDPLFDELIGLIPYGEENGISMNALGAYLGKDVRVIRQMIENARISGLIIASSQKGYYIPENEAELREYYVKTRARAKTTLRTIEPVRKKLERGEV